eukprot:3262034-Rhodomonas_salina.1
MVCWEPETTCQPADSDTPFLFNGLRYAVSLQRTQIRRFSSTARRRRKEKRKKEKKKRKKSLMHPGAWAASVPMTPYESAVPMTPYESS